MNRKSMWGMAAGSVAVLLIANPMLAEQRSRASAGAAGATPSVTRVQGGNHQGHVSYTDWLEIASEGSLKAPDSVSSLAAPGGPVGVEPFSCDADPCATPGVCGARPALLCGINHTKADFDAEHGPFARALGNLEDFERMNATDFVGGFCGIDHPEQVDCTDSGPDTSGFFCANGAIDAGQLLPGFFFDNNPDRPSTLDILAADEAFTAANSKFVIVNYFADTANILFNATDAPACPGTGPLPAAVGMDLISLFGHASGVKFSADLEDGTCFVGVVGAEHWPAQQHSFVGIECPAGIRQITYDSVNDGDGSPPGLSMLEWGPLGPAGVVNPGLCPLTDENIFAGIECIELKLDATGGASSGVRVK